MKVPVETSARHVHLSEKDASLLFGKNCTFKKIRKLSQTGECATDKTIDIIGKKNTLENVRVLMPFRKYSQAKGCPPGFW